MEFAQREFSNETKFLFKFSPNQSYVLTDHLYLVLLDMPNEIAHQMLDNFITALYLTKLILNPIFDDLLYNLSRVLKPPTETHTFVIDATAELVHSLKSRSGEAKDMCEKFGPTPTEEKADEVLRLLTEFIRAHDFTFYHFEDMRDRADDSLRGVITPPSKDDVLHTKPTTKSDEIEIIIGKGDAAARPATAAEKLEMKEDLETSYLGIKPSTFLPSLIFQQRVIYSRSSRIISRSCFLLLT